MYVCVLLRELSGRVSVEWMRVMVRHSPFPPLAPYQGPITSETQPTCMIRFPFIVLSPSILHFLWCSPSPVSSSLTFLLHYLNIRLNGEVTSSYSLFSLSFSHSPSTICLCLIFSCSNDSIENESCCSGVQWNSLYSHSVPEVSFVMELVIDMRQTALQARRLPSLWRIGVS